MASVLSHAFGGNRRGFAAPVVVLAAVLAAVASGCATQEVTVTTFLSRDVPFPSPEGATRIAVAAHTEPSSPLFAEEIRHKAEVLLEQFGYEVAPLDEASHVLQVSFSRGRARTVTHCVENYVPGWSVTRVYRHRGHEVFVREYYPGRWERHRYRTTSYTRYLDMILYQRRRRQQPASPPGRPADADSAISWRASARLSGSDPDPRHAVDYLLVAAFEYFGVDTGEQITERLSDHDPRIEDLRDAARP